MSLLSHTPQMAKIIQQLITALPIALSMAGALLLLAACTSEQGLTVESSAVPDNYANTVEATPVDFSGSWEIDYELTESPQEKIRWLYDVARAQIEQQQRALRSQRKEGGIVPARRNVSAINDLQSVIGLGTLAESISRSTILTIEQTDDLVIVKRDGDYALTCDLNLASISGNRLGKEYCRFNKAGQLVFVVALPEGLTVMNRLVMSADNKRISVATTLKSSKLTQEFTLNRVYMPFQPGKGMFECKYTLKDKKTCWLGTD